MLLGEKSSVLSVKKFRSQYSKVPAERTAGGTGLSPPPCPWPPLHIRGSCFSSRTRPALNARGDFGHCLLPRPTQRRSEPVVSETTVTVDIVRSDRWGRWQRGGSGGAGHPHRVGSPCTSSRVCQCECAPPTLAARLWCIRMVGSGVKEKMAEDSVHTLNRHLWVSWFCCWPVITGMCLLGGPREGLCSRLPVPLS